MTLPISGKLFSHLQLLEFEPPPESAAAAASEEPGVAPVSLNLPPTDVNELIESQIMRLKSFLSTKLYAHSKDLDNPLTLEFEAPFFLFKLRELLRFNNTHSLKVFDYFYLIGSTVASCINPTIIPSDLDILVRRIVVVDLIFFKSIVNISDFIKSILDDTRNCVEEVGLFLYNEENRKKKISLKPLNILEIFHNYIKKFYHANEELKGRESKGNRWGMVQFGDKLEIKYEIIINVVSGGEIVQRHVGFKSPFGSRAQDLYILLDDFLNTYNQRENHFSYDTCKFPVLSMEHKIEDVKTEIINHIISDDRIDGEKFLLFTRKFTFSPASINFSFFMDVFRDFLKVVPSQKRCHQISSQLKEKVEQQKVGTLIFLLNISFLSERANPENKHEIDLELGRLAKDFIKGTLYEKIKLDQKLFYWDFCKVLFLIINKKQSENRGLVTQFEATTYQLILPPSVLEIFILFFKKWKLFSTEMPPYALLKMAKELLPQVQLGTFKSDDDFLYHLVKKMKASLNEPDGAYLIHYMLFNHGKILEKGELRNNLFLYGSYLNPYAGGIKEVLEYYNIPCDFSRESIERVIKSIFFTQDPCLAKLGIRLIVQASPFDNETSLRYILSLSLATPWDPELDLDEYLPTLCSQDIAQEILFILKKLGDDKKERLILLITSLATSKDIQCKTLSLDIIQKTPLFTLLFEEEMSLLIQTIIPPLKGVVALQSQIKALYTSFKKVPFYLRVIALELKFHPFNLENTLEELPKIDFSLYSEDEKIYIHEILCSFIIPSLPSCNRTETNKLLTLFTLLPPLAPSTAHFLIHEQTLLKLIEKAVKYKEFLFDLLPVLNKEGVIRETSIAHALKRIVLQKLNPEEIMRIILQLKGEQDPVIDDLMENFCYHLLTTESAQKFPKVYLSLKNFLFDEKRRLQFFENKLIEILRNENCNFAVSILDVLFSHEISLLEHAPLFKNIIALIDLLAKTTKKYLNEHHPEGAPKQETLFFFKNLVRYLAFLGVRRCLETEEIALYEEVTEQWKYLPFGKHTSEIAYQLLDLFESKPKALMPTMPNIVFGCLKDSQKGLYTLIEEKILLYRQRELLQGPHLESSYFQLIQASAKHDSPFKVERLFYDAMKNEIFNKDTPPHILLESLGLTVQTLAIERELLPIYSENYLKLNQVIGCLLEFAFNHEVYELLLLDINNYTNPLPFIYLINEGTHLQMDQKLIPKVLILTHNLFKAWVALILPKKFEPLITATFIRVCKSPLICHLEEYKAILTLFFEYEKSGLLKSYEERLLICASILNSLTLELERRFLDKPGDEEFENLTLIVTEAYNLVMFLFKDDKFLDKTLKESTFIINGIISLLIYSSVRNPSFIKLIFNLIDRVLSHKLKTSARHIVTIYMADMFLTGIHQFLKYDEEPIFVIVDQILSTIEKNILQKIQLESPESLGLFNSLIEKSILIFSAHKNFKYIPRLLTLLSSLESKYQATCYLEILKTTTITSGCEQLNDFLVKALAQRKDFLTLKQ